MRIALIGKDKFLKLMLPEMPIGSYWLTDITDETEKKLINVEGRNGKWQISSNKQVKIINLDAIDITNDEVKIKSVKNVIQETTNIEKNGIYSIAIGDLNNIYFLYCYPLTENSFKHLEINKRIKEIFIGKDEKNHIVYKNNFVSNIHARLALYDKGWI